MVDSGRQFIVQMSTFVLQRKEEAMEAPRPAVHAAAIPRGCAARIGPNAIIQTVGALEEAYSPAEVRRLLERIGRDDLAEQLPTQMVDEQEFVDLIHGLRAEVGLAAAGRVLARSGERTAAYVLARRIPTPARLLLPLLPRRLGLRILLRAISGHAWTFAGAGRFGYSVDSRGAVISLADSPECREIGAPEPLCHYYTSCFQALLRPLIDRRITVREVACRAHGADECVFELR